MKNQLINTGDITSLETGTQFQTSEGVNIEVISLRVVGIHLGNPRTSISYKWSKREASGKESMDINSFISEILRS